MNDEKYGRLRGETEACRQFDRDVAEYLDGENRPAVLAHARQCLFCGVVLQDLETIVSESGVLPLVDPPARVWANIRATLVAEGIIHEPESWARRWLAPLSGVWRPAPVVALAGMLVLAVTLTLSRHTANLPTTHTASVRPEPVASAAISSENAALAQTVDGMERDYQSRKQTMEPALQVTYEKSLASLDDSIRQCQDSIQKEPDNSLARQYLMAAYQEKAEVLSAALEYDAR
ncbi:MAG TPA: anti-sigma factor [Terriglobia bacterium]|nr:anti-sigma factor [Terriglobia bacterium]